jgi:hypothetical protein
MICFVHWYGAKQEVGSYRQLSAVRPVKVTHLGCGYSINVVRLFICVSPRHTSRDLTRSASRNARYSKIVQSFPSSTSNYINLQ